MLQHSAFMNRIDSPRTTLEASTKDHNIPLSCLSSRCFLGGMISFMVPQHCCLVNRRSNVGTVVGHIIKKKISKNPKTRKPDLFFPWWLLLWCCIIENLWIERLNIPLARVAIHHRKNCPLREIINPKSLKLLSHDYIGDALASYSCELREFCCCKFLLKESQKDHRKNLSLWKTTWYETQNDCLRWKPLSLENPKPQKAWI